MKEDSMKAAYEVGRVTTGEVIVFGEEMNEAERLLKEAHDRAID